MPRFRVRRESGWKRHRHGAEAEDRLARCSAYSRLASHEPFSPDLGTDVRGARSAANAAASSQPGSLSYFGDESAARVGHEARPLPEEKVALSIC